MYRCIEFAGFAAAQVVCCLFDRQPFVPLAFSHAFRGVFSHDYGGRIWQECSDQR
jgi:hypothetical protein